MLLETGTFPTASTAEVLLSALDPLNPESLMASTSWVGVAKSSLLTHGASAVVRLEG